MRISELSRASGIPVATIKYYLREDLLPPGELTARNQAQYGEAHLHRLRLIRALIDVGGLGIADVRAVLDAIADETLSLHKLLGVAHHALGPSPRGGPASAEVTRARDEVDAFVAELGWRVSPNAPGRRLLADALAALRSLGRDVDVGVFRPYAALADQLGAHEVATTPAEPSREQLVEWVVVGTVVFEAALVALRRLAQEHHSALRFHAGA